MPVQVNSSGSLSRATRRQRPPRSRLSHRNVLPPTLSVAVHEGFEEGLCHAAGVRRRAGTGLCRALLPQLQPGWHGTTAQSARTALRGLRYRDLATAFPLSAPF